MGESVLSGIQKIYGTVMGECIGFGLTEPHHTGGIASVECESSALELEFGVAFTEVIDESGE